MSFYYVPNSERKDIMKAYQLKIQIQNSHPPIWRRIIVPAGLSFSQLSILLNEAMGWCGYHLTSFEFYHQKIRIEENLEEYDMWGWDEYEMLEAGETLIDEFLDDEQWFTYIYDFGDYWKHRVTIEKVLTDYENHYAQVLKYKGDTPYEDCGGLSGYYELLEILDDPKNPEYKEMKEWTKNHFTEEFDLERVNAKLRSLYLSDKVSGPMTQKEIYEEILTKSCPFRKIDVEADLPFTDTKDWEKSGDEVEWTFRDMENGVKNITLREILEECTKKELVETAKILHLSGYSNLKKEKLIEHLCVDLLDRDVMRKYFRFLSKCEIELLEGKENHVEIEFQYEGYDTLLAVGYALYQSDWAKGYVVIPEEVKKAYFRNCDDEWKKEAVCAKELLMYLNCAAEIYGVCPMKKALELYQRDTGKIENEFGMIRFYEDVPENKKLFYINEAKIVLKMIGEKSMIQEILSMHKNFDYYDPTMEEIQLLGTKGYFLFDRELNQLKKFFLKHGEETTEDAEDLCKRVQFLFRIGGQIDDVMGMLEECFMGFEEVVMNQKQMHALLEKLFQVMQTTRTFVLRGHSPMEVMPEIAKVVEKQKSENNVIPFPRKQ